MRVPDCAQRAFVSRGPSQWRCRLELAAGGCALGGLAGFPAVLARRLELAAAASNYFERAAFADARWMTDDTGDVSV